MTIGELLEMQKEIWWEFLIITTGEIDQYLYKYTAVDQIPTEVLNMPVSEINVVRSVRGLLDYEIINLVIYL